MTDDTQSVLRLRLRDAWGEYAVVICVVGLVALAAGGWAVGSALAVGPFGDEIPTATDETEERTVQFFNATGRFEYGATVQQGSRAFTRGERLPERTLYFTSIAPVLDGTHRYVYSADGGSLRVNTNARLVIREVDDEARYWSVTEPLESTTASDVGPGQPVETSFSVNVSEIDRRASEIRDELGAAPGSIESVVVVETTFEGTADGQPVSGSMTTELAVESSGDTYRVDAGGSTTAEERTEVVSTDQEPSLLELAGGGALAGVGFLVAVVTLVGRYRGSFALSLAERHAIVRAEFEEFITTARVPTDATDRPVVPISSLEGLVDLAIDTDGRVIHDEVSGQYVLFDDTFTYIFIPRYAAANTIGVTENDLPGGSTTRGKETEPRRDRDAGGSDGGTGGDADRPESVRGRGGDGDDETFGGWIMTEPLAEDIGGERTESVDSLPELVGLAVDVDRPVIRDANSETYVLFGDDATYSFVPGDGSGENAKSSTGDGPTDTEVRSAAGNADGDTGGDTGADAAGSDDGNDGSTDEE